MALRFMNDTRKPRHTIFGKLSYHQNIHYKLGQKICGTSISSVLMTYLKEINTLLNDFGSGRNISMTRNEMEHIVLQLTKATTSSSTEKLIKSNLLNVIYGLQTSLINYVENKELKSQLEEKSADSEILRDKDKLKEYIENMKTSSINYLFNFGTGTSIGLKLKPQYEIYIQRFGIPENGIFNPVYLGEILSDLEREKCL